MTLALSPTTSVLIWVGVLIVTVIAAGGAVLAFRRRLFDKGGEDTGGILDSLREMRNQGQITTEEFDAARKRMAARIAGVAPPPSVATRPQTRQLGVRTAKPGFDLTGAPLPPPGGPTPDKPPEKNNPSGPG